MAVEMEGPEDYVAYISADTFLDCEPELEPLIRSLLADWKLEPGEDVAIWKGQTLAAVIRGTATGPVVVRFPLVIAAAPAA